MPRLTSRPNSHPIQPKENVPITAPLGASCLADAVAGADGPGAPRNRAGGAEPRAEHH